MSFTPPASLDDVQARYQELLRQLLPRKPRDMFLHALQTRPTHAGWAHVEIVDGSYDYVVTERGKELHRRTARDADELLYWLMCDVTAGIAQDRKWSGRGFGQDSRRSWMAFQLGLLHTLDPGWSGRKRAEFAELLQKYPFQDNGPAGIEPGRSVIGTFFVTLVTTVGYLLCVPLTLGGFAALLDDEAGSPTSTGQDLVIAIGGLVVLVAVPLRWIRRARSSRKAR